MLARRHGPAIPDQLLDRLLLAFALVLVIGIPAFGVYYWFDRHPDPGPSMAERTIAEAEQAVRGNPSDLAARNRLAAAYVSAERYADGIAQFDEALVLAPDNRAALLGRGLAYRLDGRPDEALADFERLVQVASGGEMAGVDPQLQQAYYEIGVIQLDRDQPDEAVAALESALRINGSDADALYAYGRALIQTGQAEHGVEALKRAVAFVPAGWCEPYGAMVDGYAALGDTEGGAYAAGMVAFCDGRLTEAAGALQPLVGGAHRIDAWLGLALVYAADGDSTTAIDYYGKVLAEEPENVSALIGLGQLGAAPPHASPAPEGNAS